MEVYIKMDKKHIKLSILLILLLIFIAGCSSGSDSSGGTGGTGVRSFSGQTTEQNDKPAANVLISSEDGGVTTRSNTEGRYSLTIESSATTIPLRISRAGSSQILTLSDLVGEELQIALDLQFNQANLIKVGGLIEEGGETIVIQPDQIKIAGNNGVVVIDPDGSISLESGSDNIDISPSGDVVLESDTGSIEVDQDGTVMIDSK